MKNPNASDADVCRFLDADGGEELPAGWKADVRIALFLMLTRARLQGGKSKSPSARYWRDLRDRGLLP